MAINSLTIKTPLRILGRTKAVRHLRLVLRSLLVTPPKFA